MECGFFLFVKSFFSFPKKLLELRKLVCVNNFFLKGKARTAATAILYLIA